MRSLISIGLSMIACMALAAGAVVHGVERFIDWGLSLLPVTAPAFAIGGDLEPTPTFSTFADPRVQRHEAGLARLGAVRHR
jgi:hypothetical protein